VYIDTFQGLSPRYDIRKVLWPASRDRFLVVLFCLLRHADMVPTPPVAYVAVQTEYPQLESGAVKVRTTSVFSAENPLATSSVSGLHPEDGGDMFLQNIGPHKTSTALNPRRRYSS
jgi:hypothetical protein